MAPAALGERPAPQRAGFEADEAQTNAYKASQVPAWLKELSKLQAKLLLAGSPLLQAADIKVDSKLLSHQVSAVLRQHIRYTPAAQLPL